jgi:hypothetical protein
MNKDGEKIQGVEISTLGTLRSTDDITDATQHVDGEAPVVIEMGPRLGGDAVWESNNSRRGMTRPSSRRRGN